MKDMYSMEYTELRNAPHFIFNGYHTRDFNVNNVQVDSGLAKDTFLATRNLTVERTRYSDRSYLLGYTEEPLKFKVRLVFDEHKFTMNNYRALKRLFFEPTYREMKFDNDDESNLHIIMYAMVTGISEATHNVINDGYVDLEFETNSSKKYSEIMEDEYDFSKPASVKILEEYSGEIGSIAQMEEKLARDLKLWVARTNYANIEEVAKDENNDKLPDGWKLISGSPNDINIDNTGKMSFKDVHIRKRISPINNRNYYLRVKGKNGQIRVHENDYDINTLGAHQFKYRRNLLGNSGTFDLDSSGDGIGEGWVKENPKPNLYNTEELNKIIGASNIGLGTLKPDGEWYKVTPDLNKNVRLFTSLNEKFLKENLVYGEKYTYSIEIKLPPNAELTYQINNYDTKTTALYSGLGGKTIKITPTFTQSPDKKHQLLFGINLKDTPIYIKNFKLEESPYPTPLANTGQFSIDKNKEEQKIYREGRLKTQVNLIKGNKYLLVAKTPQSNSYIRIQDKVYTDRLSQVRYIPFEADSNKKEIVIGSLGDETTVFSHTRIYNITDIEYSEVKSQLLLGDNIAFDYDHEIANNFDYQDLVNTEEKFEETEMDIWKGTVTNTIAGVPVHIRRDRKVYVKPKESVTFSLWVKAHPDNNNGGANAAIRWYDYENGAGILVNNPVTPKTEWQRVSATYTNNTGIEQAPTVLFYIQRGNGNITYFTSPQIEFGKTMTEWRPTPDKILDNKYPHFDAHPYFDIDYSGTEGYIEYIDLWELNDLNKKKLDSGVPIEDIVGFDYRKYKEFLDNTLKNLDVVQEDLMESFDKLNTVEDLDFQYLYDKIVILSEDYRRQIKALDKGNNMKNYQWEDVQPHYLKMKKLSEDTAAYLTEVTEFINLNQHKIDTSSEIGNDIVTVYNFGDETVYPTFELTSTDGSDIMIRNNDTGEFTVISDNIAGEKITLVGENEQITTSRPAPYYKYDTHDDTFIRLKTGHNTLEFAGNYKVKITYQFVLL